MKRISPPADVPSAATLPTNRRGFLTRVGSASAAVGLGGLPSLAHLSAADAVADSGDDNQREDNRRINKAYQLRHKAALNQKNQPRQDHPINGDERLYPNRIASYTKAMPHNYFGEVDLAAYGSLLDAMASGDPDDFEKIPLGGVTKQSDPQAAFAFDMAGADSHRFGILAPPAFGSAEQAGEMAELYWQALTRDIPFAEYDTHPLTNAAANDLSRFSDFRGPKSNGRVTTKTLFRGLTPGDLAGPYISQFLLRDVPYPSTPIVQRIHAGVANVEYMTSYNTWLANQNGAAAASMHLAATPRYVCSGRELVEYDHRDFTYQHFLNACLTLFGMRAPFDSNNPYRNSVTQSGFATFGNPHVLDAVTHIANCGLKCVWYQKWSVHRRLRPEAFGGRVHNHRTGVAKYPVHEEMLYSPALDQTFSRFGTYLLPQAYPEGAPTHPAYPSGHAVIAGACVTMLKAFFDESFVIPKPVEASRDGLTLVPYTGGAPLTVGGELNKLAANIALGRDTAGIHWRSDGIEGLTLGEAVALSVMSDMRGCFNERFAGFSLTKFDGTTITV